MNRIFLSALLFPVLCAGCGERETATTDASATQTEVIVVGTQPFITDMPDGYTPGHLRALLDKIQPDLIAIEAATNVNSPVATAPLECRHVTIPWARENSVPVVAVGVMDKDYGQQIHAMQQSLREEGRDAAFRIIEDQLQRQLQRIGGSIEALNGSDWQQAWRSYHSQLHRLVQGQTPWELWNERVTKKIARLCADHPGRKIAVVFGAGHTYYFHDQLAKREGIQVRAAESLLPLPQTAVDRQTVPLDYLKALRPLNMASVTPEVLQHCRSLMRHVEGLPTMEADFQLFTGKLQLHAGEYRPAIATFDRLAGSAGETISQFDGRNRIIDGARLGAILALHQAGQSAEARRRLQDVLADATAAADVREFAQQMLQQIADTSVTSAGLTR